MPSRASSGPRKRASKSPVPTQTLICVSPTPPTPITFPIIRSHGRAQATRSSTTRLVFSWITARITFTPYTRIPM